MSSNGNDDDEFDFVEEEVNRPNDDNELKKVEEKVNEVKEDNKDKHNKEEINNEECVIIEKEKQLNVNKDSKEDNCNDKVIIDNTISQEEKNEIFNIEERNSKEAMKENAMKKEIDNDNDENIDIQMNNEEEKINNEDKNEAKDNEDKNKEKDKNNEDKNEETHNDNKQDAINRQETNDDAIIQLKEKNEVDIDSNEQKDIVIEKIITVDKGANNDEEKINAKNEEKESNTKAQENIPIPKEDAKNIKNEDDGFDFVEEDQSQQKNIKENNKESIIENNKSDTNKEEKTFINQAIEQIQNEINKEIIEEKNKALEDIHIDNEEEEKKSNEKAKAVKEENKANSTKEEIKKQNLSNEIKEQNYDNDKFNFIEEENESKTQKQKPQEQKLIDKDKVDKKKKNEESDSNDSIESEEDNLPRLKEDEQTPTLNESNLQEKQNDSKEEDDVFDFVDEEDNDNNNQDQGKDNVINTKDNDKLNDSNDDFDFVDEEESETSKSPKQIVSTEQKQQTQPQLSSNKLNPIPFGKLKDKITQLLSNYKEKYSINNFIKHKEQEQKEEKANVFDYKSSSHISDHYLNKISQTYSIKALYESVSKFKQNSQIEIKPFTFNQLYSISKLNKPVTQNIFNQSNAFIRNVNNQSNEFYRNLYSNYIDLALFYKKEINPRIEIKENKEKKKQEAISLKDIPLLEEKRSLSPMKEIHQFTQIDLGNKPPSNQKDNSEEFDEKPEKTPKTNQTTIEINKDLFDALSGINTNSMPVKPQNRNAPELKEEVKDAKYNEDQMKNLLLSIGVKEENLFPKQEQKEESKEQIEEELNTRKIKAFIDKLPNYGFLTSKVVEYPDSLFNI